MPTEGLRLVFAYIIDVIPDGGTKFVVSRPATRLAARLNPFDTHVQILGDLPFIPV